MTLLIIFSGCKKANYDIFLFDKPTGSGSSSFFTEKKKRHFLKESIEEKKVSKSAKEIRELAKMVEALGTI